MPSGGRDGNLWAWKLEKSCCKWGVREEGAALRKEKEGMKEGKSHQQIPGHITQSAAETG